MTFNEKLEAIYQQANISQKNTLENTANPNKTHYLYETVTEYEINQQKRFDMKFGSVKQFVLSGCEGEKITVRVAYDTLPTLQRDFQVKIDDIRKRIDIQAKRKNGISQETTENEVSVFVQIPEKYVDTVECTVNAGVLEIHSLKCENTELDAKAPNLILNGVAGTVEVNCNLNMNILCQSLNGAVEVNQISADSKIYIPQGTEFNTVEKGFGTVITYEQNGKETEPFITKGSDNIIELNGIKSRLAVCTYN